MKATNPQHPTPTATFSNRPFIDIPDDRGFPFKKAMRRVAGTGTFTITPTAGNRKGGRAGMRKTTGGTKK